MTTIQFEDFQTIISCTAYAALVPFLGFSYLRKNPKGLILKTLKQEFLSIQKITPREFYGSERNLPEKEKLKCETYFLFADSIEIDEIKKILEHLLRDHGYKIFFSTISNDEIYKLCIKKRKSVFRIEILSGTHVTNSYRVSIT